MSEPSSVAPTGVRHRWWRSIRYRLGQFLRGLRAEVNRGDESLASKLLSVQELAIFRRMPADARHHSLSVLKTLQKDSPVPHDLAVAALLHDAGKAAATEAGAYLGLWLRGPIVLAEAIAPHWLSQLTDAQPSASLRYALHVQLHHPEIGAEWAQQAGSSELTCWLIAKHQEKLPASNEPQHEMLARLQAADEVN
jgi:hypothetical protein